MFKQMKNKANFSIVLMFLYVYIFLNFVKLQCNAKVVQICWKTGNKVN